MDNHTVIYEGKLKSIKKEKETLVKKNQALNQHNSILVSARNELENLFLECADEVRKDISRRRHLQMIKYNKFDFQMNTEKMTASDKRKLLENLVYNEKFLKFVYEHMFPKKVEESVRNERQKI